MDISESKLRNILFFILEYGELNMNEYYIDEDFDSKEDKDNFFNTIKKYFSVYFCYKYKTHVNRS